MYLKISRYVQQAEQAEQYAKILEDNFGLSDPNAFRSACIMRDRHRSGFGAGMAEGQSRLARFRSRKRILTMIPVRIFPEELGIALLDS